jgi:hypothetical protein
MDALSGEAKKMPRGIGWPFLSDVKRDKIARMCSTGWRVRLQRRRVHDEKMLMDVDVELPEQQIFDMLQQSLANETPHRFAIPVGFSFDLNRLIILDSVLSIRNLSPKDSSPSLAQWRLQSLGRGFFIRFRREDSVFHTEFSPNASAFAFVSAARNPGVIDYKTIQIWSNVAADEDWPLFECKGEVLASGMRAHDGNPKEIFAFHPSLPLIAYCAWRSVVIWKYNEGMCRCQAKFHRQAHFSGHFPFNSWIGDIDSYSVEQVEIKTALDKTPASIWFSADGKYVQYMWFDYDIKELMTSCPSSSSSLDYKASDNFSVGSRLSTTGVDLRPRTGDLGMDLFSNFGYTSSSALVAHKATPMTITGDGAVVNGPSTLLHLPRLQQEDQTNVSRLPSKDSDEWFLSMWNKSAQPSYSIYDHQPRHLPSIIYRRQQSISNVDGCSHEPKRRRLQ